MNAPDVFAAIGEGAALLARLDENAATFFDDLTRLREILALLGDAAPAASITFDRNNLRGTLASMLDYLARPTLPPAVSAFDATTVWILARELSIPDAMEAAKASAQSVDQSPEGLAKARVAVFEHFTAQGISREFDLGRILQGQRLAEEILARGIKDNPEYVAARDAYHALSDARAEKYKDYIERLNAIETEATDTTADADHRAELTRQHSALYAEFLEWKDASGAEEIAASIRMDDASSAFWAKRAEDYHATYMADGEAIRAKVLEASPVTEEQAHAWASKQVINQNARDQLAKMKPPYPLDQLVLDMAEFYRMAGGRASTVQFSVDGGGRANAEGVEAIQTDKTINIGSYFNKRVLWHELAHYIENDPVAKAASNGFIISRRESDTIHKLKDLAPLCSYDEHEVAYKDSFVDPYVGKVYVDGVTEVFSMGVERLCNPKDATIFAAKLDYHALKMEERAAALVQKERDYAVAYKFFVARAPLAADDWWSQLPSDSAQYNLIYQYVQKHAKKAAWTYVGSSGQYRVFSGLFKDQKTKRWAKGFAVFKALPNDEYQLPDYTYFNGKLDRARALIGINAQLTVSLDATYRRYIDGLGGTYDWKQMTIDLWKSMQ
jgi:hypothetical protein